MNIITNNYYTLQTAVSATNTYADYTLSISNQFIDKLSSVPFISVSRITYQKSSFNIPNLPQFTILPSIKFPYDCCLITDMELSNLILPIIKDIFNGIEMAINGILIINIIIIIIICLPLIIEFIFELVPKPKSLTLCIKIPKIIFRREIILPMIFGIILIFIGVGLRIMIMKNMNDAEDKLQIADNKINEWVYIININTKILFDKVNDILQDVSRKAVEFIKQQIQNGINLANTVINQTASNLNNAINNAFSQLSLPTRSFFPQNINIPTTIDFDIKINVRTDILEIPKISIKELLMPILLQMQEAIKDITFWICIGGAILFVLPIISVGLKILTTYLKI
jgi:uncharacterized protein YoxC